MKKSFSNSSKLNPRNFVRRVLSRSVSSTHSKISSGADETDKLMDTSENSTANFETELSLLKKQIEGLQITVNSMQHDTDKKTRALDVLSKEKDQLAVDLKKQRRSNVNLKQQLEDERAFYYKEKEQYCNEMNNCKKIRREEKREPAEIENTYKKEIAKLKNNLDQTLEANYNLSVKFLRMKNTKLSLKTQLKKLQKMHDRAMQDYRIKLEDVQKELDDVVREQFLTPIHPSNKKYLQIIKQNGSLMHENLCLQLEVDRLNFELERMKMNDVKNDTNNKLKYIHNTNKGPSKCPKCKSAKSGGGGGDAAGRSRRNLCETDSIRTHTTSTTGDSKSTHSDGKKSSHSIKKIYEKDKHPDIPSITMLPSSNDNVIDKPNNHMNLLSKPSSKYDLMTISHSNISQIDESEMTYYSTTKTSQAYRTQSAPEIVQSLQNIT